MDHTTDPSPDGRQPKPNGRRRKASAGHTTPYDRQGEATDSPPYIGHTKKYQKTTDMLHEDTVSQEDASNTGISTTCKCL